MPSRVTEARWTAGWVILWLMLALVALITRPVLPIDETRYLSVAWEMWHGGHFLVPHVNGLPYSHKPPLLFWLIHLGWVLWGVNAFSARMTAPVFGLLGLFLTVHLAGRLWPAQHSVARHAPFVLLGLPLWAVFGTLTMFDLPLAFFVLLGAVGFLMASGESVVSGWALAGIAMGAGLLTKGPVILLHLLPLGLLAPWWMQSGCRGLERWRWYAGLLIALLIALTVALAWALPAADSGGAAYAQAILWHQTAGRMVRSFAHSRPVWWYATLLPLVLFPWCFEMPLWRRVRRMRLDPGSRFCLSWALPPLLLLSLVSGKQIHYLIPLLPPVALLFARGMAALPWPAAGRRLWPVAFLFMLAGIALLALPGLPIDAGSLPAMRKGMPIWGLLMLAGGIVLFLWKARTRTAAVAGSCAAVSVFIALIHVGPLRRVEKAYDIAPMSAKISRLQTAGRQIAVWPAKYAGQFQFAGRLTQPLATPKDRTALRKWTKRHPGGYVVLFTSQKVSLAHGLRPEFAQPFRRGRVALWRATVLQRAPKVIDRL